MSGSTASGRGRTLATAARAVALRPRLWPVGLSTARRLAPPGWWRHPPFLPVPDSAYWRFRMHTAFGEESAGRPTTEDIVDYLAWCQRVRVPHR